ncbi:MAG: type IV secretory system conjugative DNA transfer family protein [Chitinophagales bacterium]|nr:type IV secretory system conjugative DNA transfer family protein [Chitinophagales bacterium]
MPEKQSLNEPFKNISIMNNSKMSGYSNVTQAEIKQLFETRVTPEAKTKFILLVVAAFLGPITILGTLWGFKKSWTKFVEPFGIPPRFYPLLPIQKVAMIIFAILAWLVVILLVLLATAMLPLFDYEGAFMLAYLGGNLLTCGVVYAFFRRWMVSVHNLMVDEDKFGSATLSSREELEEIVGNKGLFVGGGYGFNDKGHILTFGATRSGKGKGLIIPNVLRICDPEHNSMVVLDIKGESTAVCQKALEKMGGETIVLNPWDLLPNHIHGKRSYNPLEILRDVNSPNLIDDISIISELICPLDEDNPNKFFVDSARNLISGVLLHIATTCEGTPHLQMLWEAVRLFGDSWDQFLASMFSNNHPVHGPAVSMAAQAIARQQESPETFSSILSNVLQVTDFIKSDALRTSMESDFDPYTLADGNKTVFIICPADRLMSQSTWMRLVVITLMRAVVRKPNKKVTFLIDEAASSLGYITELEVAFSVYAGFNISTWLIYQDLPQFQAVFPKKWENLYANAAIRQFLSVRDNTSAKYISDAMGTSTRTVYSKNWFGNISNPEHIARPLRTPEEVKSMTKDQMIFFAGESVVVGMPKPGYYEMAELAPGGVPIYSPNPYIENSF